MTVYYRDLFDLDSRNPPVDLPHKKRISLSERREASKKRVIPELKEDDLEETFIRGRGPGGQATNKVSSKLPSNA